MPSRSLTIWRGDQAVKLNELENAHIAVGGIGPGRRYATEQINHAYLIAVAAQFQAYCRNLHSEAADYLVSYVSPVALQLVVSLSLTQGRRIDRGNAQPGSIGEDFKRFGLDLWNEVKGRDSRNARRQERLEQLNIWRNAIAHQDFNLSPADQQKVAGTTPRLKYVRRWRAACNGLATAFDATLADHLDSLTAVRPW
jgi:hypothetical protein